MKTTKCPVCASSDVDWLTIGIHLAQCARCHHVFRSDPHSAENSLFESADYIKWRATSQEQTRIAERRISLIDDLGLGPGSAIELGCSTGEAIASLLRRGWDAYGLDVSEEAVKAGNRALQADRLRVGLSPKLAGLKTENDLVVMFHVVEHVIDIDALGRDLNSWVKPGGLLYLRLPNWSSWSRRFTGRNWPSLMPEHVHHFTLGSMRLWLERHEFEPVSIATAGRAREWLGAARRLMSASDVEMEEQSMIGATPRRLKVIEFAEVVGRPWLALEERLDRGSEMVVLARRVMER